MPLQAEDLTAVAAAFARVGATAEMERFFAEILTAAEMHTLALRWRLLQRLNDGVPQRRIAAEMGISLCKITRGSRILKNRDSVTARLLRDETKKTTRENGGK